MSSQALLVVIGGLPGVGKTTLARALAAHIGAIFLRVDSIEQAMRRGGVRDIDGAGYEVARAVASDNLRLGRTVIAECVNPWPLTRDAWRDCSTETGAPIAEIEVICSDPIEHRRRVESRRTDIPGLALPTWDDVVGRDYRPWDRARRTVDTATRSVDECLEALVAHVRDASATVA